MYNRYIRNDRGEYERIVQEEIPPQGSPPVSNPDSKGKEGSGLGGIFKRLLGRFKLEELDKGDILLLVLLFLLFTDGDDDELMIALALLFII